MFGLLLHVSDCKPLLERGLCGSLLPTSQANDCHAAPALHSQQRHHPAKEIQRHSAFPIWTWIQEGHQHPGQQEVKANVSDIRFSVPEVMNNRSCTIISVRPFLLLFIFALLRHPSRSLGKLTSSQGAPLPFLWPPNIHI